MTEFGQLSSSEEKCGIITTGVCGRVASSAEMIEEAQFTTKGLMENMEAYNASKSSLLLRKRVCGSSSRNSKKSMIG